MSDEDGALWSNVQVGDVLNGWWRVGPPEWRDRLRELSYKSKLMRSLYQAICHPMIILGTISLRTM